MYYKEIEPGVFLYLKTKGNNQLVDWLTPEISIQIIHHSIMIVSTSSLDYRKTIWEAVNRFEYLFLVTDKFEIFQKINDKIVGRSLKICGF